MAWNFENDIPLNGIFWCSEAKPVQVIYLSLGVQSDNQLSVTVQHNTMYHVYIYYWKMQRVFANPLDE